MKNPVPPRGYLRCLGEIRRNLSACADLPIDHLLWQVEVLGNIPSAFILILLDGAFCEGG